MLAEKMNHRIIAFFLLLTLSTVKQEAWSQAAYDELPSVSIGIGYFGELFTHPGFVVFGEFGINKAQNQLLARMNLIGYRHKGHTQNFIFLPELVYRRNTKNLNYWEASLGTGVMNQRADALVYEFSEGNFTRDNSGWIYFVPSLGIRYGRSFTLSNGDMLIPSVGTRLFYQYPFNDFWLQRVALDLSVSYQIK